MADKAADLETRIISHSTISDLPTNYIQSSIKYKIFSKWQNYWDTITHTHKLKTIKKDIKKWTPPYYLNRQQEVTTMRCFIGHSFLTQSFLISKDPPPTCDEFYANLLVQHIILDFTKYQDIRINLEKPLNVNEALNKNNISKINPFLTKINPINKF